MSSEKQLTPAEARQIALDNLQAAEQRRAAADDELCPKCGASANQGENTTGSAADWECGSWREEDGRYWQSGECARREIERLRERLEELERGL